MEKAVLYRRLQRWVIAIAVTAGSLVSAQITMAYEPPPVIHVGGDVAFPPMVWNDQGQPNGFSVDLAKEMVSVGGSRAEHHLAPWADTMQALESGQLDVVPMYYSEERAERFIFTHAFYFLSHAIYAMPATLRVSTVNELNGRRVVVEDESFALQNLRSGIIRPHIITAPNTLAALEILRSGRADYAILTTLTVEALSTEKGWTFSRMGTPFWSRGYAFAVNKNNPELAAWLQAALNDTIASGRYQTLYEAWKPTLEPSQADKTREHLLVTGLAAALGIILIGLGLFWGLRRTIAIRTQELSSAIKQYEFVEGQLRRVVNFDTQTGLARQSYFIEQVDDYLHEHGHNGGKGREVLIIKLADLNAIIRTFGITHAEALVNAFATQLAQREGEIAGYLGRGVFAVFIARGGATALLDRLVKSIARQSPGLSSQLLAGSAYWPEHGRSTAKLIRHAETALASSAARRRRWLAYDTSMEPSRLDLDIISVFMEGRVQGIYAVFQPQLDLRKGTIRSAEILVRWQHPRLGDISPSTFIPLLEQSGLIEQITTRMINEAVRVSVMLRQRNIVCSISVNVATYDLIDANLSAIILNALRKYGGHPSDLRLELTETAVASDPQRIKQVLSELAALGVGASVDDFGTGYSSLSYLSMFPLKELKIDRSFVTDMLTNSRNHSLVRSTILMAKELGLSAVAEGVEDDQTLQMLRKDGCDYAQGFVIAKPMNEIDFIEFMRAHANELFDVSQFIKRQ